jgi:hypothetical protein
VLEPSNIDLLPFSRNGKNAQTHLRNHQLELSFQLDYWISGDLTRLQQVSQTGAECRDAMPTGGRLRF